MKAMVLAAGFGTRLRPYSLLRPKPLFPVLDCPLLIHTCQQLQQAGVEEIIVNCHHLREQIVTAVASLNHIITSIEEIELGTGGGLRHAAHLFDDEALLVVNGDIFHTIDLPALMAYHEKSGADATLVLHDYPRFNKVMMADNGAILSFSGADQAGQSLAFTGIQIIHPSLLDDIPSHTFYNMIDCYSQAIASGKNIAGYVVGDHFWSDMGTPADYLQLHGQLLSEERFAPPSPYFVAPTARCAGARFSDWVSIGSGAIIGQGAQLSRVVVWDGATVEPGAQLQDVIIT